MAPGFTFDHHIDFTPESSAEILRSIPSAPGVFALRGPHLPDGRPGEPYLTRTADLRRRLRRLLSPPEELDESGRPILSKRLNLRDRVRSISYTRTGSDFESTLTLYSATRAAFGPDQARKRLRLHTPFCIRITMQAPHPRAYVTNRLSARALPDTFGPFPSRAAAERYCDAVLDLFKLRRCSEDLEVSPSHPGCAYGEMNMCLQPCKAACTPETYSAESAAVRDFFRTRGESLLSTIAARREAASEAMDFEAAATLHKQFEKTKSATQLADELVRPLPDLRALILQPSAPTAPTPVPPEGVILTLSEAKGKDPLSTPAQIPPGNNTADAALFLLANGRIHGPARLSTLGVRAVREQTAVGSSLFAQPLMLTAIPLAEPTPAPAPPEEAVAETPETQSSLSPEDRARATLAALESQAAIPTAIDELCDSLALFRRWYFRPEKQRPGEVLLPNPPQNGQAGQWPIRRLLNAAARVVLGPPTEAQPVDREAFKNLKTKTIHPGREGVERTVPVLPPRKRTRKSITPTDLR